MLGNAGETELDLRFRLFDIPVRVHPAFWLVATILWWDGERLDLTFVGIACVFISILVHELGHALMFRRYGYRGEIVLYFMGGYATGGALSTWKDVIVSFAGPGAGFLLYGALVALEWLIPSDLILRYDAVWFSLFALKWINLWWGIINLTPCLPLDGGRIMAALVHRYWTPRTTEKVLWISAMSAGGVALWAAGRQERYVMILFGILCAQSIVSLNQYRTFR